MPGEGHLGVFPAIPGMGGDFQIFAEGPGLSIGVGLPIGPHALRVAANAIGVDVQDLLTQLSDGSTVADVAGANSVDVQTVIDALVAEAEAHLDEKVADGDLTQAEADERLAEITDRITDMVNNGPSFERGGFGRP